MKFEKFDLSPDVIDNLLAMGFHRSTDIQFKCIPAILNGEDVLAIAQTGTGKTAAFAIPIIDLIHDGKTGRRSDGVACLVMVPTRELAQQIGKVFAQISKGTRANSYAIYGGVEQDPQISQLAGGVDILIATPGRMFDLISQGHLDVSKVEFLVLDEADHMLDLGFIQDIEDVKRKLPRNHQTLFFSATINPKIKKLAYSQVRQNALRIQVSPQNLVSKNVKHSIVNVGMDEKRHLLVNFALNNPEAKTIVFVRTQVRADRVLAHLQKSGVSGVIVNIHGGLTQEARDKSLAEFREGKAGMMIATDVSARGIDLPGITHVINYDLPDDPENYVHRVGRTGRGFAKGSAASFVAPEEAEKLAAIQEFIQSEIEELKIDDAVLKETLGAVDVEDMSIADILAAEEARFGDDDGGKKKR